MVDIFIAYSHNDLRYKDELKKFLRPLLNTGRARVWDDYDIEGGQDWEAEIKKRLYGADVIILLVSPDSLASEYFYGKEVAVSLERHEKGEAIVVPVIIRPCAWTITPLQRLEALPEKGKPVTKWDSQDDAFTQVAESLGDIVETILAQRRLESEQADTLREFKAAVEAAEHLLAKEHWEEARKAYASALALHLPGFSPDTDMLRQQVAACDIQMQDATARQRQEQEAKQRQAEQEHQRAEAARKAQEEAERYRQQEEQRRLKAEAEAEKRRLREAARQAGSNAPDKLRLLLWALGGLAVVLVVWLALRPDAQDSPAEKQPDATETPEQLEDAAYQKALADSTIPALKDYLFQHEAGKNVTAAQIKLKELQDRYDYKLQSARSFERGEMWEKARQYYEEALQLNPGDADIVQKLENIKKKK